MTKNPWPVASQRKTTDLSDHTLAARRLTDRFFRRRGKLIGSTAETLYTVGGEALFEWLSDQTPKGSTIGETLAAIAVDAMYEDKEEAS